MKDHLLTAKWNNIITTILGLPIVGYIAYVLTSANITMKNGFIGLVIFGVLY